jgi:hypothetical protein
MNPLPISLPRGGTVVFNSLYDSREPILLTQDILLVSLPNNTFIDVGWYPEHDPKGTYCLRVYQDDWQNQLLAEPIRTRSAHEVAKQVAQLAVRYSTETTTSTTFWRGVPLLPGVINTSCSSVWPLLYSAKELQDA